MRPLWDYLKANKETYLIALPIWVMVGRFASPALFVVVPITLLYFSFRGKGDQVVVLFATMLILADHQGLYLTGFMNQRMFGVIIMSLYSLYQMRLGYYKFSLLFLNLFPLLMVIMLAIIESPVKGTAFSKGLSFFLLYFVGFHFIAHSVRTQGTEIIRAITMNGLLVLSIGLIFIVLKPDLVFFGTYRFNGLFRNPNGLGVFSTMMLPFFYYYIRQYSPPRFFRFVLYFLVLLSVVLCSSRNALMGTVTFFILTWGLNFSVWYRVIIFAGVLPLVFLVIQTITVERIIIFMGAESYLRLNELESGSGRTHAWAFAVKQIAKKPIIGMGFGYEEHLFTCCMPYDLWKTGHQGGVHNSYLAIMLNVGAVGLVLFFAFLGLVLVRIKDWKLLLPFLILYMFSAVFESWMVASLNAFHIYFVVMLVFLYEKAPESAPATVSQPQSHAPAFSVY